LKTVQKLFVALAAVVVFSTTALAETKVGVIDTQRLMEEAPQAKAAQANIETEFAPREQELVALQKQIRELEDKAARDGALMSEKESSKLERDVLAKRRELKRTQDEFRDDLNIRKNEVLSKLQRQMYDATVSLAKEKQYDVILGQGVIYSNKTVDVTDLVLDKLKTQAKSGK
jgi:outer membrane protein